MARKSMATIQAELHRKLGEFFLSRLTGEFATEDTPPITANELGVMRQWLKDNNVVGDPERPDQSTLDLARKVAELDLDEHDLH